MLSVWPLCPQKPEIMPLSQAWVTSGSCPAGWGKERQSLPFDFKSLRGYPPQHLFGTRFLKPFQRGPGHFPVATPHTEHQKEMPTVHYVKEMSSFYATKPNHVERWAWPNASPATLGAQGRPLPFPRGGGRGLQFLGSLWALPAIDFLALKCETDFLVPFTLREYPHSRWPARGEIVLTLIPAKDFAAHFLI